MPALARRAVEHLHAVDAGHDEVEQHEGDGARVGTFEDLQGLLAALGGLGVVAEALDGFFENAALGGIVVDDQDELGHGQVLNSTGRTYADGASTAQDRTDGHAWLTHRGAECPNWVNASFRFGLR